MNRQHTADNAALIRLTGYGLADELVVIGMTTDPKPQHTILSFDGKRTVSYTNACGPKASDLFEMKRGVFGVEF